MNQRTKKQAQERAEWHRGSLKLRQLLRYSNEGQSDTTAGSLRKAAQQPSAPIEATKKSGHPRFHEIVQQMSDLHNRKNTDYAAGTAEGPLGNFVRASKIMRLYPGLDWASPFGVCIAFMLKQFDAGLTLKSQKRESVTGEPLQARLMDVAVYSVLARILDEEANKTTGV